MKSYQTLSVESPANIAFIKYWGQRDSQLVLPYNDSFSMNLSACKTIIDIDFYEDTAIKEMEIQEFGSQTYRKSSALELEKVTSFYPLAKKILHAQGDFGYRIRSRNTFPLKAGIASSASFFSALAYAFMRGFDQQIPEKDLSILARRTGSGSAARSVPDGFVWWQAGDTSETSFAYSIADHDAWDIVDIVLVVSTSEKKVSSQKGHQDATTSPYFLNRQSMLPDISQAIRTSFEERNFTRFGELLEQESMQFHSILMTQIPPLFYWSGRTLEIFRAIVELRKKGIECYATTDAGENVHLIAKAADADSLVSYFQTNHSIEHCIVNHSARGTRERSQQS